MTRRGAEWRRWEPHIHAPGTVLNNQFRGPNAWDEYLSTLEAAVPPIEVLAVTDYYVTDTYEEVLRHKAAGRLPSVKMVMPNVEVRLEAATSRGGFINLHLLVSPEESDHLQQLQRLLSQLLFEAHSDRFHCTSAELVRLGKRCDPRIIDDRAARAHGATQFKVSLRQLREVLRAAAWARGNILVAVAGNSGDGTSGLREAADQTTREEIEAFADIIFASSDSQRSYWLGRGARSEDEIRNRYRGLKPCLHGSDAHKPADVAAPAGNRFSWVKGSAHFDALRHACIDPANRSHIGADSPRSATPSQVIATVEIENAAWAQTPLIHLNPGLVAIIGARGSGKTALADILAAGCDAILASAWEATARNNPSFLARAKALVADQQVRVDWGDGAESARYLDGRDAETSVAFPRARYLSQQFVEDLCSPHGPTDQLIEEIQRVVFEAHPTAERDGAIDFPELLDQRASLHREARRRDVEAIGLISDRVAEEQEKKALVPLLKGQVAEKQRLVDAYIADRGKLVPEGGEERAKRHAQLAQAVEHVGQEIRRYANQRKVFHGLQGEVRAQRQTQAPEELRQTKARHPGSGMNDEQWAVFLLDYKGDVDSALAGYTAWVDEKIAALKGKPAAPSSNLAPISDDADLATLSLSVLEAELSRMGQQVNADKEVQRQYATLTSKIATEGAALKAFEARLADADGAADRARALQSEREAAYERAFDALVAEQAVLADLYEPLSKRLATASGALRKLSFTVERVVDVAAWASHAENGLLDLRKQGAFKGRGALLALAEEKLRAAWETGTAHEVRATMANFLSCHREDFLAHAPEPSADPAEFRGWLRRFARWLYDMSHVTIRYAIAYDGTDIGRVSPGTRGIVLLLLYLALDDADDRPLIIDQPEENLDPKSVFEELVPLFILAKSKRQVIMVTHNANLVVNTDADQIIVADCGPNPAGGLPLIKYKSGGLEEGEIRGLVCKILEGGERAFQERARRLRVYPDK